MNRETDGISKAFFDCKNTGFGIVDDIPRGRSLSDQPVSCPLCGAILRQSRNLRRHLELLHFGVGTGKTNSHPKQRRTERSLVGRPSFILSRITASSSAANTTTSTVMSSTTSLSTSHASMTSATIPTVTSTSTIVRTDHLHHARISESLDFSTISSLPITSAATSHIAIPGGLMGSGTSMAGPADPNDHSILGVSSNTTSCNGSMAASNNSLYSTDMLGCLLPSLPSLPTLSSPHDVFRHGEMLRAGIAYHDTSRQHARHMQRTDVT